MSKRNEKKWYKIGDLNEDDPPRGIGGILAKLWRNVLDDSQINGNKFETLLNEFIVKTRRGGPSHRVSSHITGGNLRREFQKNTMTFKVFMKGLRFLKIRKVRFIVEATHYNGELKVHAVDVDISGEQFDEEMMNNKEE